MSSPFLWRGQSSQLTEALQPHKGNKKPGPQLVLNGSRPHGGAYCKAIASEVTQARIEAADDMWLEDEIAQVNVEVERHFLLAQTAPESMRTTHRDEARRLAKKAADLILRRSPEYVAQLERERGLS